MLEFLKKIRSAIHKDDLPQVAMEERILDHAGVPDADPGIDAVVAACTDWICTAQDHSASGDGGVARDFSLIKGWATSYPETTGYIIPTMIEMGRRTGRNDLHDRARRMLDWCIAIQFPEGGFQGGRIDSTPKVPVTFNTGQVLLGLAAGAEAYGEARYVEGMHRAARWLKETQDDDGCWRRYPTPFAAPGEKAYETHVSWGLFEAERVASGYGYGAAGLRQVDWALTKQLPNGWFESNCLSDPKKPLTHTIGYVLRGILEAHLLSNRTDLLVAARGTADGLLPCIGADGRLSAQLDRNFQPAAKYVCLTGSVQIAHCLFLLFKLTTDPRYLDAGRRLNAFVRRTVRTRGSLDTRGGVKGSFPIDGEYGKWQYLNWAAKFAIDSNLLEADLLRGIDA